MTPTQFAAEGGTTRKGVRGSPAESEHLTDREADDERERREARAERDVDELLDRYDEGLRPKGVLWG